MIAEAEVRFFDAEARRMRERGERFECAPERFAAINGTRYGVLARAVVEAEDARSEIRAATVQEQPEKRSKGRRKA